jgi:hypothetical protein
MEEKKEEVKIREYQPSDYGDVKKDLLEAGWNLTIYPEQRVEDVCLVLSSDGIRVVTGKRRDRYNMPQNVDLPRSIRNIISQKPAISRYDLWKGLL